MDLDETFWELQWHSACGRGVRRLVLTRRGLRRTVWGLAVLGLLVLLVVAATPVGLKGFFGSFTVDAARRENRARRQQADELREQLGELAGRLAATLDRARRVAWAVGVPAALWQPAVSPPPGAEAVTGWLIQVADRLDALAGALQPSALQPPATLLALPLQLPVGRSRGVPVGLFGWQASPFTGKPVPSRGVTWACQKGEAVLAPGGGTVVYAGAPQGRSVADWMRLGTIVVLDHGGGVTSVLGHLQQTAVRRGQIVSRGQRVGSAGISPWTKVPAVYLEIRWPMAGGSKPVDPSLLIPDLPVADLDALLGDPGAGLPADFPSLEPLLGRRRR